MKLCQRDLLNSFRLKELFHTNCSKKVFEGNLITAHQTSFMWWILFIINDFTTFKVKILKTCCSDLHPTAGFQLLNTRLKAETHKHAAARGGCSTGLKRRKHVMPMVSRLQADPDCRY